MNIRQQLIEDYIDNTTEILKVKRDKAFEIFAHTLFIDTSIHSFNPNDNVDGGQDKQIDMITIDDTGDEEATIYITQIKNVDTFSSNAIIQLRNGLDWIFNKKKNDLKSLSNIKFKDKIEECRNFRYTYGPSNLDIKVAYITKGLSSEISEECRQEIKTIMDEYDNETYNDFSFELIGSHELIEILNTQEKKNKKIDIDLKIDYDKNKASLISYNSQGLKGIICTCSASEIALAVMNDKNGYIFDLNIRRFLGKGKGVNKDILQTCTNNHESNLFWFLNNGITITCDKIDTNPDPDNPIVKIKNIQIVNGCQTASSLALALRQGTLQSNTKVLVRIYETSDLKIVDRIVLTTNNQNVISGRNLRANDNSQIDLKKAFRLYGYYLETKPREYDKDLLNKDLIIPNDFVAVAYLAIVLKRPSDARSRKYKVWNDFYRKIFDDTIVEPYILSSLIYRKTSSYLIEKFSTSRTNIKRYLSKNASFHISRIATFKWLNGDIGNDQKIIKYSIEELLNDDSALDSYLDQSLVLLQKIIKLNEIFKEDLNNALKSYELDAEINKNLYRTKKK